MPVGLRSRSAGAEWGFTLVELLATVALLAILSAIAVPSVTSAIDSQRLGIDTRNVERELQSARLSAVMTNQPIRVRFNCPAAGQYRRVELIGSINLPAADDADTRATVRCGYPYPADTDHDPLTRPNNDGPTKRLDSKVTFQTVQTLEFWPNGTVHVSSSSNPWPIIGSTPVTLILAKGTTTKSITVNNLGKIQIQ